MEAFTHSSGGELLVHPSHPLLPLLQSPQSIIENELKFSLQRQGEKAMLSGR